MDLQTCVLRCHAILSMTCCQLSMSAGTVHAHLRAEHLVQEISRLVQEEHGCFVTFMSCMTHGVSTLGLCADACSGMVGVSRSGPIIRCKGRAL